MAERRRWLMPYPQERALDDVAFGHGRTPTRIFGVMLPIWQVEVRATVTDDRPYELIDRFLEKAMFHGGLSTVAELSRFLALEEAIVDRAIRVLIAVEHVTDRNGVLSLTDLGRMSVRDGKCYLVTRQDRRRMYFDAFQSRPLSRRYYDPTVVTFLPLDEVTAAVAGRSRPFLLLHSVNGFRRDALATLLNHPDRAHYNLPARVQQPESLGETVVYLPMYVVWASQPDGTSQLMAYTQADDTVDWEITDFCTATPEIVAVLAGEHDAVRLDQQEKRIREWLARQNLSRCEPTRLIPDGWRVALPPEAFEPRGPVQLAKLGSFVVLDNDPVHVWCEDDQVRQRALVERADVYLAARRDEPADVVRERITRMMAQLGLASIGLDGLAKLAVDASRSGLADRLIELSSGVRTRRG